MKPTNFLHFKRASFILWVIPILILSGLSTAFSNKNHLYPCVAFTKTIQMNRKSLHRPFHSHETQTFIIVTSASLQLSNEKQQKVLLSLLLFSPQQKWLKKLMRQHKLENKQITDNTQPYLLHTKKFTQCLAKSEVQGALKQVKEEKK